MALSQYTERMVSGLVRTGDWDKLSDEKKKAFILGCERLATAALLAKQMGESSMGFDVDGTRIIPIPAKMKNSTQAKENDVKSEGDKKEAKSESSKSKEPIKQQAESKAASDVKEDIVKTDKAKEVKEEKTKETKPEAKAEAPEPSKEDEPKPQGKAPSDGALMTEFARTSMHMTWDALRRAGIEPDKVKEFTKGYVDSFKEKGEAVLDKMYQQKPKKAKDPKVDGPRPEPVTDAEKRAAKLVEPEVVASDAMEKELGMAKQELIQQQLEAKAASTMSDITRSFVRPAEAAPTKVSAAEANPALHQQQAVQTTLVPIRQNVAIPLPQNWYQMSTVDKCYYLENFEGQPGVPNVYDPCPDLDEVGKVTKLKQHINFKPKASGLIHTIQMLGLLQLITGNKLASKMNALGAADATGDPHLTEIGINEYASNMATRYDMAFTMPCHDASFYILILFSSVPELKDGGWVFDSSIQKVKAKKPRNRKYVAEGEVAQQPATAATRNMEKPSGLGMGVKLGDILSAEANAQTA